MSQSNENDKGKDAIYSSYVDRVLPKSVFERIQYETNRRMVHKFNNNQVMNPLEWAAGAYHNIGAQTKFFATLLLSD